MSTLTDRLLLRPVAWYLRHCPLDVGRWRLILLAVRWSKSARGALPPRVVRTWHGFDMLVDGESQAGRILYATGLYERDVAATIERLLEPGATFIDGGAHIGFFSIFASRRVGSSGRVIAFEPARATRDILQRNTTINRCTNVTIRAEGLGRSAGAAMLAHPARFESGHATMRSVAMSVSREEIPVVALDDELDALGLVHAVKLDLEGGELDALKGMQRLLASQHPDVIVEVTDTFLRDAGGSAIELYQLMTSLGYLPFFIRHDGLDPVKSEGAWQQYVPTQFNALFTVRVDGGTA
jgi:FkbM family methyltransferase